MMKNQYLISLPETQGNSVDDCELVYHILKTQNFDYTKPFKLALLNVPFFEAKIAEPSSMYLMINSDGLKVAPESVNDVYNQRDCVAFSLEDKHGQCLCDSFHDISADPTSFINAICAEIISSDFGIPEFFRDSHGEIKIDRKACETFIKNNLSLRLHSYRASDDCYRESNDSIEYQAFNNNTKEACPVSMGNNPLIVVRDAYRDILTRNLIGKIQGMNM